MYELPTQLTIPAAPAIGLILIGLIVAFVGKTLLKAVTFLIGAVAGAGTGFVAAALVAPDSVGCLLAAVLIGAILGGMLALALMKGILAISLGIIVAGFAAGLSASSLILLVVFLASFVLAWFFMDTLLAAITGIGGGLLVGIGVSAIWTGSIGAVASLTAAVAVSAGGIYYQFSSHKGDLGRPQHDGT